MNDIEWKNLIQAWTGMTEDQWEMRQKLLKVAFKISNYKKEESRLLLEIIRPFFVLGFRSYVAESNGYTYEPSLVDCQKMELENTLLQQQINKEEFLSKELNEILKTQNFDSSLLKRYSQAKVGEVCLEKVTQIADTKSRYFRWLTKIQNKYGISGICPNTFKFKNDCFVYPFSSMDYEVGEENRDISALSLISKDLDILNEWKWIVADKFLSLSNKNEGILFWSDKSEKSDFAVDFLKRINPFEILSEVTKYDKAQLFYFQDGWDNPYFVLALSTGLEEKWDNTLEIYSLLNNKLPEDMCL